MSGKRNVSVSRGHELANALYTQPLRRSRAAYEQNAVKAAIIKLALLENGLGPGHICIEGIL